MKRGLGKTFGSLLPEDFDKSVLLDKGERIQKIKIADITPDPNQPRRSFEQKTILELADSIKRHGILQPLVVRPSSESNKYIIIAGERRYRAAKKAGLESVPVLVRSIEELERLEIGLIENMQRVDLSPLDQALSIARLNEQFNIDMKDIALRLGKAHTTIVNTVRLLQLPDFARVALANGEISEGHARAVLALKDDVVNQKILIKNVIEKGWSVRDVECFVKALKSGEKTISRKTDKKKNETNHNLSKQKSVFEQKIGREITVIEKKSKVEVRLFFDSDKDFIQFTENL